MNKYDFEPRIIPARNGFLAVSSADCRPRIGVIGSTEVEARERFTEELAAWSELAAIREGPVTDPAVNL